MTIHNLPYENGPAHNAPTVTNQRLREGETRILALETTLQNLIQAFHGCNAAMEDDTVRWTVAEGKRLLENDTGQE